MTQSSDGLVINNPHRCLKNRAVAIILAKTMHFQVKDKMDAKG